MTFIEMLINAIYKYFDRYINLVDTESIASTASLSDVEPELHDVSSSDDELCTHAVVI